MKEQTPHHWTDDENLLADFVLNRLPSSTVKELNEHLTSCLRCQEAVKAEQSLAAGIKAAGRKAMKVRLESAVLETVRTQEVPRHAVHFPWPRVVSLAAVVLILVAVGVYNDWFRSNIARQSTPPLEIAKEEPTNESAEKEIKDVTAPPRHGIPAEEGGKRRDNKEKPGGTTASASSRKQETGSDYKVEMATKSPEAPSSPPTGSLGKDQTYNSVVRPEAADEFIVPQSQSMWVEGHVATTAERSRSLTDGVGAFNAPNNETRTKKMQAPASTVNEYNPELVIAINQRPASALPHHLQNVPETTHSIQTLIESRNDSLAMTLYLDPLLPDSDLHTARIVQTGEDSIVVTIANRQIGYRLPPGLLKQVNSKTRNVK